MALRFLLLPILLLFASLAAHAQSLGPPQFPIKGDDGASIPNHSLTAEQMAAVGRLPGIVNVGSAKGDVTLYEFYDLNCPFCRRASRDVDTLLRTDPALRMILVPYPVLSAHSIEGARVELAVRELAPPRTFLEFHRRIYAGRGVIDGARALAVARELGIDQGKIIEIANMRRITDTMKTHAQLGAEFGLLATPAYVVQGVAILGHPGLESLRKIVRSVRTCKKVVC